jgi:beta-aspartyl-peptidase (threonine type)
MFGLVIHGGAGLRSPETFDAEREKEARFVLQQILETGHRLLSDNATALEVVTAMVSMMEDSPLFNAGHGAVLASDGQCYFDASIMDGASEEIGAVAGVQGVQNPIQLAQKVMTDSRYVMLAGEDAAQFATEKSLQRRPLDWFVTPYRQEQLVAAQSSDAIILDHEPAEDPKKGTVGAVALDAFGNLAAATSTGGMCNKRPGRIGDAGIIGAGTFARNATCAVSCTGHGERFIQHNVAGRLSAMMEFGSMSLTEACERIVHQELPCNAGGLIAIDANGNIATPFNTGGMFHGWLDRDGKICVRIWQHEATPSSESISL